MSTERLSRRITTIAESATMAVDAKAKALKAAGEPVIGFGAGEPNFATPSHIVEAAVAACQDPANHKYTPGPGGPPSTEGSPGRQDRRDSRWRPEVSRILITNGGKHAVYNTCAAALNPGDEVLLPAPYWTTYPESIALAGATPVPLPTDIASGFRVTVDQLSGLARRRPRRSSSSPRPTPRGRSTQPTRSRP
ncbi:MAG: hypothetical protein CM1200mP26_13720 [Acidimicrobiales bacterium]|nr:MAG: hypothetical protein CM1200mP26_13720 [Acidimicrobiales bacterium]